MNPKIIEIMRIVSTGDRTLVDRAMRRMKEELFTNVDKYSQRTEKILDTVTGGTFDTLTGAIWGDSIPPEEALQRCLDLSVSWITFASIFGAIIEHAKSKETTSFREAVMEDLRDVHDILPDECLGNFIRQCDQSKGVFNRAIYDPNYNPHIKRINANVINKRIKLEREDDDPNPDTILKLEKLSRVISSTGSERVGETGRDTSPLEQTPATVS